MARNKREQEATEASLVSEVGRDSMAPLALGMPVENGPSGHGESVFSRPPGELPPIGLAIHERS